MVTCVLTEPAHIQTPQAAPPSRASWCGQLKLGTLCVPVKAYAAIATPPDTPLRQIHAPCRKRIEYRKCCPTHGAVPAEEIVKAYPYQPDQYVPISEQELAALQPDAAKTIYLEHFLDPQVVDLILLAGRSLYLAPANAAANRPFAVVHQALKRCGKWAIGRVVFSGKWQIIAARSTDESLLLHTLHHPAQRRAFAHPDGNGLDLSQKELRPFLQLIDADDRPISWEDYQDDWEHRLAALVESKVAAISTRRPPRAIGKQRSGNGRGHRSTDPRNPARRRKPAKVS